MKVKVAINDMWQLGISNVWFQTVFFIKPGTIWREMRVSEGDAFDLRHIQKLNILEQVCSQEGLLPKSNCLLFFLPNSETLIFHIIPNIPTTHPFVHSDRCWEGTIEKNRMEDLTGGFWSSTRRPRPHSRASSLWTRSSTRTSSRSRTLPTRTEPPLTSLPSICSPPHMERSTFSVPWKRISKESLPPRCFS